MLVYTDLLSDDQMLSDAYPREPLKIGGEEVPNVFVVQSKMVTSELGDINIGANASAEGGGEEAGDDVKRVNNMTDGDVGFGYQGPNEYTGEEFKVIFRSWCKAIKAKIEESGEKPKDFMKSAKAILPFIQENFADLEFYAPKSFNPDTFVMGWWNDKANEVGAPAFIFLEKAYKIEKY
mmetsp:Transcript_12172/g.24277  ORF Transcript_12172/g.24277 Transcript_12172/m.24277 type:complete len:179 (-) Transcript_12172:84-620(-)|eukprot:CAMPEP_0181291516 /NCGR_PEP_ID=MMETSP1101-20121128/2009_1 /TAXON_ID=46948 /ORGANISM="Rhodomonas abbreviata, Strain Caron Lab Isolate" /LENGTH=178 /DNA_ID=CAMNT_0023395913 /DNA_START=33 /DNA_END=569 /DNA_ORIENTATION=-